ncbi:MAG: M28 family peptidase, partial [Victivallales bacterium]
EKFRILPTIPDAEFPYYTPEKHPKWCESFICSDGELPEKVKYVLTFRPFSEWPELLKTRYLGGKINILPFPGSLIFWGSPHFRGLQGKFAWSQQLPLLRLLRRHHPPYGVWVQQSGWLFDSLTENEKKSIHPELLLDTYKRTHRHNRVNRYDSDIEESTDEDIKTLQCLFSNNPEIIGLYGKPLARNSRIFTEDGELVLDGPTASRQNVLDAAGKVFKGGLFEYMFCYPPMRCGGHEVFWQRPLVGHCRMKDGILSPVFNFDSFNGYLAAYQAEKPDLGKPIELIPEFNRRETGLLASLHFKNAQDHYRYQTAINCLKLFYSWALSGKKPLPRRFARRLLRLSKTDTLDKWLDSLPGRADTPDNGRKMRTAIEEIISPETGASTFLSSKQPHGITLSETATRKYEEKYWNAIATLAGGRFINKNNADIMLDETTRKELKHDGRDLKALGNYLIECHQASIESAGMNGAAICGEHSFKWRTESDYPFYNGWLRNREDREHERNILVIIPGKNRKEAIIMADHYDTAYEEDVYYKNRGGTGARISTKGADDNHSATATLLLAAPIFLKLSKEGKLERDIWLLHLTGEEFPADCLGARNFCEALVRKNLKLSSSSGETDLSGTEVKGVFVLDMVAHNNEHDPDVFQISPGDGSEALLLASHAHTANEIWNENAKHGNESEERKNFRRDAKSSDPAVIPEIAPYTHLHGEIRPHYDMKSSLFNTDGQIFSDAGIPVVLFMENYDISRAGYHDTLDTMGNINLDYGAGVSAIAIEAVAQTACADDK